MSARFVDVDRETPMLLPPDLRDWVPEDDLVHFILEAVQRLPLEDFQVNHRGSGNRQFPPTPDARVANLLLRQPPLLLP